jgi:hypothetical protein
VTAAATLERLWVGGDLLRWHEAGHVTVAAGLGYEVRGVELGLVRDHGATSVVIADPWDQLAVFLAGRLAERRSLCWQDELAPLSDDPRSPDGQGIERALGYLADSPSARARLLASATERADWLLVDGQSGLRRLAAALRTRNRLDGTEVKALLG